MGFPYWNWQDVVLERCMATFGEPVIVYPAGGNPAGYVVRGIWETRADHAPLGLTVDLSNPSITVDFRIVELPDAEVPTQGMQLEARATRWEVVDVEQDGGGRVKCRVFRIGPGSGAPLPPVDMPAPIPPSATAWVDDGTEGYR
jgi:hypothetical protein